MRRVSCLAYAMLLAAVFVSSSVSARAESTMYWRVYHTCMRALLMNIFPKTAWNIQNTKNVCAQSARQNPTEASVRSYEMEIRQTEADRRAVASGHMIAAAPPHASAKYWRAYHLCVASYGNLFSPADPVDYHRMSVACSNFARHPTASQTRYFESQIRAHAAAKSAATARAIGSFLFGLATGMAESYRPPVHARRPMRAPAIRYSGGRRYVGGRMVRTTPMTSPRSGGGVLVRRYGGVTTPVRTPVTTPVRTPVTTPVRTPVTTPAATMGGGHGPIGYIRQPNGTLDPYYATQPCRTMQQTGPTSYQCTNY